MDKDLELRTKRVGLAIIEFAASLPRLREIDVLSRQLLRSATAIGGKYREANRGFSRPHFVNNIGTVQKQAAETHYCLGLLMESQVANNADATNTLQRLIGAPLAIFTAIGKRLKQ